MHSILVNATIVAAALVASAGPLAAAASAQDAGSQSDTWVDLVRSFDTGKLVIIFIFGSGFVAAAGYAVAGIIRAFNGSPDDSEELSARIDELEERVEKLEAKSTGPPATV